MIRILFGFFIIFHGLVHLMGFLKAYNLADAPRLTRDITRPWGILWFVCAVLYCAAATVYMPEFDWWWMIAAPALAISQTLIIRFWKEAKFGTIVNIVILAAVIVAYGSWNFTSMTEREMKSFRAAATAPGKIVTKERLSGLPPAVRKWLERSNLTDREFIRTVRLTQTGKMRSTPDGIRMDVDAEQWIKTGNPGFIWIAKVSAVPGINLAGRDKYLEGKGRMLIKLFSLFKVADSKGKTINEASMVRYLAEMIWYPTAALDDYIRWNQVDSRTVQATIILGGVRATGYFRFDEIGDISGFEARRYYERKSGATLEDWVIRIDPASFTDFDGIRIPAKSSVTWKLKEGDFTWLNVEVSEVRYNDLSD